jgi:glycosyltransferase involved in cell wall biosynthesis
LDIPVIDLGMASKWRWDAFWRLFTLLRGRRPTILHSWLFHANLPGRVLGRLAGVPVIICAEQTMAMEAEWRYFLNRKTSRLVDRVVAASANVRDFCIDHIGLPAGKVVVIHNSVEGIVSPPAARQAARQELGLPLDGPLTGTVSRLDPVKGVDYLLRAFAQVRDGQLVVIGDGPERTTLHALADGLGLTGRVHWAGYRSDVPKLLPALDIFVQPSLHEGLPNAVLEAMAAGLPVVATKVGGTPEAVLDGVTGVLVPARDPVALAEAITALHHDPDQRHRLGQAGVERVEQNFSVEHMARQTQALYDRMLTMKQIC